MTGGNGFYHMERLDPRRWSPCRSRAASTSAGACTASSTTPPTRATSRTTSTGTARRSRTSPTARTISTRGGTASSTYTVRPSSAATEGAASETATVWAQQYLRIPLQVPAGGTTPVDLPDAERGVHVQRQRRQRRRRRRRRRLRDHPQVGSVELEGQLAVGLHRQRLHRRVQARRHAAVADRSRAQHPRRRALHAVRGHRLRRRRQGGDGGEDRARDEGRHRRLPQARPGGERRRHARSTGRQRRLRAVRARVPDGVQRPDRRGDGDGELRGAARHGELVGRQLRQPRRSLPRDRRLRRHHRPAELHHGARLLHADDADGLELARRAADARCGSSTATSRRRTPPATTTPGRGRTA